jgi:hypothetical protein
MASNGLILPSQNGANGLIQPLSRADEVDDVSGCGFLCREASKKEQKK